MAKIHNFITHLSCLEAEAIEIMREVVSEAESPAMLYSVGQDSAVMLHLAKPAMWIALSHMMAIWTVQLQVSQSH